MNLRQFNIRALMIAILVVAVLMGGMVAAERTAPKDFPLVFRIMLFEGFIAAGLLIFIRRVIPRDRS